ncbi:MAG: hypothetical protein IKU67_05710 [Firmicutes bacterium]|nr:hypothetical protein [Bacillota bacterium]
MFKKLLDFALPKLNGWIVLGGAIMGIGAGLTFLGEQKANQDETKEFLLEQRKEEEES